MCGCLPLSLFLFPFFSPTLSCSSFPHSEKREKRSQVQIYKKPRPEATHNRLSDFRFSFEKRQWPWESMDWDWYFPRRALICVFTPSKVDHGNLTFAWCGVLCATLVCLASFYFYLLQTKASDRFDFSSVLLTLRYSCRTKEKKCSENNRNINKCKIGFLWTRRRKLYKQPHLWQ